MKENNKMTQQEIFVNTLKVLVLANERKDILCDEKLDNYYKSLIVLFGRACIMQQLSSNIYEELCRVLDEIKKLESELERLETSENSTLYDKELISKDKEIMEGLRKKYGLLLSCDNVDFYEKVTDKILIEDLKLTTCTSSSIAEKIELLITYDLNNLFKRNNSGDCKYRLLELSEFKTVHDLLIEKKVVEEFKKDLYEFFSREEMQFLSFCYSNNKSIAFKRFYDILLTNIKRAIKYLRVIYDQNNSDKEFNIDDITEIYNDYKTNDYPYSYEFIKAYEYVVYLNSLLNQLDYIKKDTKFEKKFNMIEEKNEKLFSFFQSKFMNESNNKPFNSSYPLNEDDYSFLSATYADKKNNVVASFDNINNRITLNSTKYEKDNIDEIIKQVSKEINSSYQFIEHLDMNAYIDSVKGKISEVFRLEAYKEFVYPNQKNDVYFSPKKYRKLLLSEDFDNVFMHRDDTSAFNQYGIFMLDTNFIFNLLIDENSIFTKLDLFLFLKNVIGLYLNENELFINNKDESSILSNDTISSFFSKFTETFNREGDIFEIIKSYSDELIEKGYIEGLDKKYTDAMDVVENYSSMKSVYFNEMINRIRINRKIKGVK